MIQVLKLEGSLLQLFQVQVLQHFTVGTNEVFTAFSENDYSLSIMTTGSGSTGVQW